MISHQAIQKSAGSDFHPSASTLLQRKCACGHSAGADGWCEECRKKKLQRKANTARREQADSAPQTVQDVLRSPGQPLDEATRDFMETRFGHSFEKISLRPPALQNFSGDLAIGSERDPSEDHAETTAARVTNTTVAPAGQRADFHEVRIHTDARAAESADAIGAHAFTAQNHVVFGAGQFAPGTRAGQRLVAHELTHVLQQTGQKPGVLRRQPKTDYKEKKDAPAGTFVSCDKDRTALVQSAMEAASQLATRAVTALEREYPLSYEGTAMRANFGSIGSDQKSKIVERYKHVLSHLGSKTYKCSATNKTVTEGNKVVDVCGEAVCPGDKITIYPDFGKETCPAGPVLLHEALHNTGACDDINKGANYPPSSPEDNPYCYEYFAVDLTAGYKTPELKKRDPKAPH